MKKVSVAELQVGMKIAQKVENKSGMVLLPEGIELTESHIGRLKKWGIENIFVEGEGDDGGAGIVADVSLSEDFVVRLDHKFENVKDDPIMLSIYNAIKSIASK